MKRFVLVLVALGAACLPAGAQAAFGISEFDVSFTESDGSPVSQAGSHPFAFTSSLELNTLNEEVETDGRLKDLLLDMPPKLVFHRSATPYCLETHFETVDEGVNDCPDSTALGVIATAAGEADNWSEGPVFNLVPHPGELMRLGFRVGGVENVLVHVELSPEPPHELTLSVEEFPESIELFGLELQLWGVPGSPSHDEFRGVCAVSGGGAPCPVAGPPRPLLTLPTRCGNPLELLYQANPWEEEGSWVSGGALTHDAGGEPLGLTGCGALPFGQAIDIQPTTGSAASPTGLDLSVSFEDEGLENPGGIAESRLRDLVVALPEGMSIDPSGGSGLGLCSQAQLAEEGPEALEGDGCPDASRLGALEVESPLIAGETLKGGVYLGTPLADLAKREPVELYAVARNVAVGIVIKQVIEIEPDPETGQLIAYAEDMPQLPFSQLDLSLFEDGGSPLVTPARCGNYEIEAELSPWADNGDYLTLSDLSFATGPGGGSCPSDEVFPPSSDNSPPPAGDPPPATSVLPPPVIRHCPKGKRAVRRNGVRRCIRRCPKGKRLLRRKGKKRCIETKRKKHRKHHRRRR